MYYKGYNIEAIGVTRNYAQFGLTPYQWIISGFRPIYNSIEEAQQVVDKLYEGFIPL